MKKYGGLFVDKGIIKMAIIVMVISMTLLVVSICVAAHYGGLMMNSVNTSDQTNQNNGTGTSDSSGSRNQK